MNCPKCNRNVGMAYNMAGNPDSYIYYIYDYCKITFFYSLKRKLFTYINEEWVEIDDREKVILT